MRGYQHRVASTIALGFEFARTLGLPRFDDFPIPVLKLSGEVLEALWNRRIGL
jgi:hypothetical protein